MPTRLDHDCYEAFNIQVHGLHQAHAGDERRAHRDRRLGRARFDARADRRGEGVRRAGPAAQEHPRLHDAGLRDFGRHEVERVGADERARRHRRGDRHQARGDADAEGHRPSVSPRAKPVYDVTFENVQAGLRTDYLFRLANQRKAFVLGTGDLSELALGWCTYGVGDHMSHYNVNGSVSKTLIQYLVRWVVKTKQFDDAASGDAARRSSTPRSRPSSCPRSAEGDLQSTQSKVGPYELQDFHLFYITRYGLAAVEGRFPRVARVARRRARRVAAAFPGRREARLHARRHQEVARRVPVPLLRDQPVQALGAAERAEGGLGRQPLAARRLARAVGRQCAACGWTSSRRTCRRVRPADRTARRHEERFRPVAAPRRAAGDPRRAARARCGARRCRAAPRGDAPRFGPA